MGHGGAGAVFDPGVGDGAGGSAAQQVAEEAGSDSGASRRGDEKALNVDAPHTMASTAAAARRRRARVSVVLSVFLGITMFAIAAAIGPFPELLLKRECASRGLHGGDCKKGEKGTPHRTLYDDSQKAASKKALYFSLSTGVVVFLSLPLVATVGDAYGRKTPLVISTALQCGYGAAVAAIPAERQNDLLLIVVTATALGGGVMGIMTNCFAAVADITVGTETREKARRFAIVETCMIIGFLAGPLSLGGVADAVGLQESFWVPCACNIAGLVILLVFFDETHEPARRVPMTFRRSTPVGSVCLLVENRQAIMLALAMLFSSLAGAVMLVVAPFYVKKEAGWSATMLGLWQSAGSLTMAVGLGIVLPIATRKISLNNILKLGTASVAVTTAAFAFATHGWLFFVLSAAKLIDVLVFPVGRAAIANIYGKARYGEALAAVAVVQHASGLLGPLYALLYSATEDVVWGPVHGMSFLIGGGIGLIGVGFAAACPTIDGVDPDREGLLDDDDVFSRHGADVLSRVSTIRVP